MSRPVDWWGRQVERQSRLQVERMSRQWWARNSTRLRRIRNRIHWFTGCAVALLVASALVGAVIILSALTTADKVLAHAQAVRERSMTIGRSMNAIRCRMLPELCPELKGKKTGARLEK